MSRASTVLAVLLLCGAAPAQALHKDAVRGFQFKPPKDYQAIALDPLEKVLIAKYQDPTKSWGGANGTASFNSLYTIRFYPTKPATKAATADGEETSDPALKHLESAFGFYTVDKENKLSLAGSAGRELQLTPSANGDVKVYAALLPQEDGIFLFEGVAVATRFSKEVQEFARATKSFKRTSKADTSEHDAELAQMDEQERFLQQQIDKLPPGWSHLRTKRYLFLFDADKAFVKQMGDQVEAMRDAYEKLYPPDPKKPITAVSIVRVCASFDEFAGYSGAGPGVGGYWNDTARELVFYDKAPRTETLCVLNHEAFHQYIYYFYGELAPHSWYNEGHGDYFSGARLTKTYRITEYANAPGGFDRTQLIKDMVRLAREGKSPEEGAAAPLKELLHFSQPEYYSQSPLRPVAYYPEGWAVVHYLRETRNLPPKQAKLLPDYLQNLLTARAEVAEELMKKRLADAEKVKEGSSDDMPKDPKAYYGDVDQKKVQDRAYDKTFKDWTEADWAAFQEAVWDHVEKRL